MSKNRKQKEMLAPPKNSRELATRLGVYPKHLTMSTFNPKRLKKVGAESVKKNRLR
jgi:hypothetical protein